MGGLNYMLKYELEQQAWRLSVADNLWLIATQQIPDKNLWRPYSEHILKEYQSKNEKSADDVKENVLNKLKELRKEG